jgi:uncharacterized OB-fold protein
MKTNHTHVPQLRLRSDLAAGESVDACLNNLDYWTKTLETKCAKKGSGYVPPYPYYPPYTYPNP